MVLLKALTFLVGGLVVAGGGVIGTLYALDLEVGATVVATHCAEFPATVDVKTDWFGSRVGVEVASTECGFIQPGHYVEYRIRTERISIYSAKDGVCLWDSEHQPTGCDE